MAAYNSVNGATMTANPTLLRGLLKTEWEFAGVVVSDWSAARTTVPSAMAGLDLVMPGPDGPWGEYLLAAVRAGKVPETEIDDKVSRLLVLAHRVGALNGVSDTGVAGTDVAKPRAPALVDPALVRQVASRSFVLLKNRGGLLPLDASGVREIALIGPNAIDPTTQGGGSVRVLPVDRPGLVDALRSALGTATSVSLHQGCRTSATIALPENGALRNPLSGEAGVRLEVRSADGTVVHDGPHPTSVITWWDGLPEAVYLPGSEFVLSARYRAAVDGRHVLGAAGVGLIRVVVDGSTLAEATTLPPRDIVEAFSHPPELRVTAQLRAGQEVEVRFEHRPDVRDSQARFATMRLGITPQVGDEDLLEEAAKAAAGADVAVVVVGSADGTESEGYDRQTLALPGRQDDLVRRVAAANANTVVVVNTGMPVLMPWADEVSAILQVWLPGQAFGEALADSLLGVVEPGGRLPVSVARFEADSPVLHAKPEAGELAYAEGLLVGYRGYDRSGAEPLFCFGHGLGYTDWSYEKLAPVAASLAAGEDLQLLVTVRNAGARPGREVVQLYLEGPDDDPGRPLRVLAAFASVGAGPGEQAETRLTVPARHFHRWDDELSGWISHPGTYTVRAGRSSRDLRLSTKVVVQ